MVRTEPLPTPASVISWSGDGEMQQSRPGIRRDLIGFPLYEILWPATTDLHKSFPAVGLSELHLIRKMRSCLAGHPAHAITVHQSPPDSATICVVVAVDMLRKAVLPQ